MYGYWTGSSFSGLNPNDYRWNFGFRDIGESFSGGVPVFGGETQTGSRNYGPADVVGREVTYADVAWINWDPVGGVGGDCRIDPGVFGAEGLVNCSGTAGVFPVSPPSVVPEPSTWIMLGTGLLGLGFVGLGAGRKAKRPE